MSNVNKFVKVKTPHKSSFDKSFSNLLTIEVGTITPLLCDELIPNTTVDLKVALNACLAPLASDCYCRADIALEAFFVPTRILYQGFSKWLTGEEVANSSGNYIKVGLPRLILNKAQLGQFAPGKLADYLGFKATLSELDALTGGTENFTKYFNVFPFLAYHKVYDDWYRNTLVQRPVFVETTDSVVTGVSYVPFRTFTGNSNIALTYTFVDGTPLGSLRQRNFGSDYFTYSQPNPQLGDAQKVRFDTNTQSSEFTVASLRSAVALQSFLERNSLASYRLQDWVKANYNADLKDGVAQRAIYLGSGRINAYTKGIYQTTNANSGGGTVVPNNPFFTSVGAEFGSFECTGAVKLVDHFTAEEPGYLMVLVTLVPTATYSSGVLRQNYRYNSSAGTQTDMANPLLQGTGNEPIYRGELNFTDACSGDSVFGYTEKYSSWMTRENELHGKLRDGESLAAFALQRTFGSGQTAINSSFLRIPKTYMDQVAASIAGVSGYGAWVDSYLDYKVSMPLQKYSIPSIMDPQYEHGEEVTIQKGGSRID